MLLKRKEKKKKKTLNLRSEDPYYDIGQSKDSYKLTFLHLKMRRPVWKLTRQMFVKARGGYWCSAEEQAVVTSSGTFLSGSSLSWACGGGGGTGPCIFPVCSLSLLPPTFPPSWLSLAPWPCKRARSFWRGATALKDPAAQFQPLPQACVQYTHHLNPPLFFLKFVSFQKPT